MDDDGALTRAVDNLRCEGKNACVSSVNSDLKHHINAIAYSGDAGHALQNLAAVISAMAGSEVLVLSEIELQATFKSRWLRFVDDVKLSVRDETTIDVRSRSRVGYYDFGVNRRRVESIREQFMANPSA